MRIGYYDVEAGEGVAAQADVITALGQNPFLRSDLQEADTQRAGVLFVQNGNEAGYTPEFIAAAENLAEYVNFGRVLVMHDAAFAAGAAFLAGLGVTGASATFDNTGADAADIDFVGDFGPLTAGPAGPLDDTSLDGGTPSNNGYISIASVQDEEVAFLTTRADAGQGVTLLASTGSGYAIYSSIVLGDFLGGPGALDANMEAYAGNLVRFATRLSQASSVLLDDVADSTWVTTAPGQDVFGGGGNDTLEAVHKRSILHGEEGNDLIDLSGHADLAWGGTGNDTMLGSHADDQLWGGADNDRIKGSNGEDFLVGGSGLDGLNGGEGDDKLFGGDGDDTIRGGLGRDYHDGGLGADRFIFVNDGVGTSPGPPPAPPLGGPLDGLGVFSDYVAHFEIAAGDLIDIRAFGPINFSGAAYIFAPSLPEFIIEDNLTGIDRVLLDWDGDGTTDFEIHVEDADGVLTSADIDWIPYPT